MKNILLLGLAVLVTACFGGGGGGGGGGSGSSVTGSAIFENFTAMGTQNNICRNYSQPTDNISCTALGGTWNNSRDIVTTTTGSYDESTYAMSCTSGTATPSAKCRVNGVDFAATAGLNLSSVDACLSNGGAINIVCTEVTGSEMVDNCTGAVPADATECSSVGGTFYATLHNATGSITTSDIVAGTNTIQTLIDSNVDVVDVMSLNPQAPVYLNFTLKLKISNFTFWQSTQSRDTGSSFISSGDYETFTVASPVATSTFSPDYAVAVESATLYFE